MTRFKMHAKYILSIAAALLSAVAGAAGAEPVTKVYVPTGSSNEVIIFGSESDNLIRRYNAEFEADRAFAKPDNSEVWLFGPQSTQCEVINATSDRLVKVFDTEIEVKKIVFSPDGTYGFAIGYQTKAAGLQVFAVDCENYELLYPLTEVNDVGDVAVNADSRKVWISSVSKGTITSFNIPSFEQGETVYVGPEPVDLEMVDSGKVLIAVCRGLAKGENGGAQLSAVSPADGTPLWINNNLGSSLSELAIGNSAGRFVLTYYTPLLDPPSNIREFSGKLTSKGLFGTEQSHYLLGQQPHSGLLLPDQHSWIACDPDEGIISLNLESDSLQQLPDYLAGAKPDAIALVSIDVDRKLAEINSELAADSINENVPEKLLELAYLQKTAGDNNEVVTTYKRIIEGYSASYAAIEAGLEMSKFSYNDKFFIQSAEYAVKAMTTLADYLAATATPQMPPASDLKLTVERLAQLSDQFGKDYLKDVARKFLDLSVQSQTLANLYFDIGFHLYRIKEEGTARKCFTEVKSQLTAIDDPVAVRGLSARLALATGEAAVYYKIKKMKNAPTLDGVLSEWKDVKPIEMSATNGWYYGRAGWRGNEDLSGALYVAYNESDIFFAGSILDDSLVNLPGGKGDLVRIFLDLRPNSGNFFFRDKSCDPGCFQFSVIAPTSTQPKARLNTDLQAPYQIASSRTAGGYDFELRIPLVAFGKWFSSDSKRIGLGIELVDNDNPEDPEEVKALGFVLPTDSPDGTPQPLLFGVAELQ